MPTRDERARLPQPDDAEAQPDDVQTQPNDAETKLDDVDWPRRFRDANLLIYKRLLDDKPVRAIKMFLECFDEDGRQVYNVPPFVLEYLAVNFSGFMQRKFDSVDDAFGGQVARQRQAILSEDKEFEIIFDFLCEHEKAKKIPKNDRTETPFEMALEIISDRYNMSTDNVHRIYKKSKPR